MRLNGLGGAVYVARKEASKHCAHCGCSWRIHTNQRQGRLRHQKNALGPIGSLFFCSHVCSPVSACSRLPEAKGKQQRADTFALVIPRHKRSTSCVWHAPTASCNSGGRLPATPSNHTTNVQFSVFPPSLRTPIACGYLSEKTKPTRP